MRRVIEYSLISVDGVFEDPIAMGVGDHQDEAYLRDGLALLEACDGLLFGRRIYEAFAALYRDGDHKPMWADHINTMPKYVFSSSLEQTNWSNASIVRGDVGVEVARLKQQDGGDLLVFGHGLLGEALLRQRLTDQLDLAVFPLMTGRGKGFFRDGQRAELRLVATKMFSQVVKLSYEVV